MATISCAEFALFFVDFWFQLARWIDSTIIETLYGWESPNTRFDVLMELDNAFANILLNFVMATMFIVLPSFWVVGLTWAGVRTGNILSGLTNALKWQRL